MSKSAKYLLFIILILSVAFSVSAQTRTRQKASKKSLGAAAKITTAPETGDKNLSKKNERPDAALTDEAEQTPASDEKQNGTIKTNQRPAAATTKDAFEAAYFYEFAQPNFVTSQVSIAHDESGKGRITFLKKDFSEPISDPLQLSAATLEKINNALQTLNFLDSTENYQYEKDYSHLGNVKIKIKKDGREREVKFNWTQNKDARILADEYRKIANQFIWKFDISVARENQPLEAPRLLDAFDALIRRNEISDAAQMVPFLKELGNDERIPLIARNHATRLVEKIEKAK